VTSNGHRLARIAELAREIADVARAPELEKPINQLTDAEAVDAVRRMCKASLGAHPPYEGDDAEDQAMLAERALRGRQGL
jgi:hypothetical protein